GSENVTNVMSVIEPGVDILGHLSITGTPPPQRGQTQPVNIANIRINLQSLDNLPSLILLTRLAQVSSDGTFTFPSLIDARYFINSVGGLPSDAYVSDLRIGAQSFYDSGFFSVGKAAPEML